ncbi:hypothetical protein FQN51_000554 [Onygenales sp. PD_10]|nr:hypothetical protein FQN51_000554 [Onygenales sp. PD_10]
MDAPDTTAADPRSSLSSIDREPLPTDSMVTVPLSDAPFSPRTPDSTNRASKLFPCAIEEAAHDNVEPEATSPANAETPKRASKNRSDSVGSSSSRGSRNSDGSNGEESESGENSVDWGELEKTEQLESKSDPGDESTALLLARLEQENTALAGNPKSGSHVRKESRPPSIRHIKRLVDDPSRSSLRFSQLPTPPMTELEFWAALVADYTHTATRLPTLTSNKIRGGVPPPLRGVVWPSIAGARDDELLQEFEKLSGESSPYEGLIGKDIGRSFPNVEMFRDPNGEGQLMLGRVLRCFSLYDTKIGYCQGLGFVVGPLLMHMTDSEAFCVLVRLMDHYDLRSCFLPTLAGLHLRIYQFQTLLSRHEPELHARLEVLKIEPVYVSQWFLSFFAVTCPLSILLRIYDVLLLEGACETLMRVALALMKRNKAKILACDEFEDVMQLLLSRSIWDIYGNDADSLVQDFVSLTHLVTRESLQELEASYKESQGTSSSAPFPQMQAAASRFLGRLWAGSGSHNSVRSLTVNPGATSMVSRPSSVVRRTPSKQSVASTMGSFESASDASTAPTEASSAPASAIEPSKPKPKMAGSQNKDKDLHSQIEDLLTALRDIQRQHADLAMELQREREEREEDQAIARLMLGYMKEQSSDDTHSELISKANDRFLEAASRPSSIIQTKHQLREDLAVWKEKHDDEASKNHELGRRLEQQQREYFQAKDQLKEARSRLQDSHSDKQRLERTIRELRQRKGSRADSPTPTSAGSDDRGSSGLRELKLGRTGSTTSTFSKRTSSLGAQALLSTEGSVGPDESIIMELANAKTSEAIARQELEEVKAKLDSLRRLMGHSGSPSNNRAGAVELSSGITLTTPVPPKSMSKAPTEPVRTASTGGFFGWGRRTTSTSNPPSETK